MRPSLSSPERRDLPLIAKLIPGGIRLGTVLLVEFDADSEWFAVAATILVGWVKNGSRAIWYAEASPREEVRNHLAALGLNVVDSESARMLLVEDWYSATLGLEPTVAGVVVEQVQGEGGPYDRMRSMRVADWSLWSLKGLKEASRDGDDDWGPGVLEVADSISPAMRFNEEKPYLEWHENRTRELYRRHRHIGLFGVVRGLHSDQFYKRMEIATDGVIDIRVMEDEGVVKNLLRVRSLKGQPHDTRWHEVQIKPNGEAVIVS